MKILKISITAFLFLVINSFIHGQEVPSNDTFQNEEGVVVQDDMAKKRHHAQKVKDRKAKISEKLELSDQQKEEWNNVEKAFRPEIKDLRLKMKEDRNANRVEMQDLRNRMDAEFVQILTEDQRDKWTEMKEKRKQKKQEKRKG